MQLTTTTYTDYRDAINDYDLGRLDPDDTTDKLLARERRQFRQELRSRPQGTANQEAA